MALPHVLTGGPNGPPQRFGVLRSTLILAQLLTAAGFFIAVGGVAKLQKTANSLPLRSGTAAGDAATADLVVAYTDVFQSAGEQPYPLNPHRQFAFQWFILFLELSILVGIAVLAAFPATILRLKHALASILTYAFVLLTFTGRSLLFFHWNAAANKVYGSKPINAALAGVLIVLVANGVTLIMLGLLGTGADFAPTHHVGGHPTVHPSKHQVADGGSPTYQAADTKV